MEEQALYKQFSLIESCLFSGREWENRKNGKVKITMLRIYMLTATLLREILIPLGITDIFDPEKTELSKDITSDDDLKLSSAEQYVHLIMNGDGVEAASIIVSDSAFYEFLTKKK